MADEIWAKIEFDSDIKGKEYQWIYSAEMKPPRSINQ
jgi:hypothetical protein